MKLKHILLFLALGAFISMEAQKLQFRPDSTFKIVQFTDVHFVLGDQRSDTALLVIDRVIADEKPDLVVFSGDIVTGKPVKEGWNALTKRVTDKQIPFAVTFGNHDDENGVMRNELAKHILALPLNVNSDASGVSGALNCVVPVFGTKKEAMKVKNLLYFFDSKAYSTLPDVEGYGWMTDDLIAWYKKQSQQYTYLNNLQPVNALAFFHIPLPEYTYAFNNEANARVGERGEDECAPKINSGMFAAMKEMRDVMGTFVGHDHVNNYVVDYFDIALAYGQFSGWRTTYHPAMNGARVIVLKADKREFETWRRMLDGSIKDRITYPHDLKKSSKQ